jgi:hypothetical protein
MPIADAGVDIVAELGQEVVLDGSKCYDIDGEIINWTWHILPIKETYYGYKVTCIFKSVGYYFINLTYAMMIARLHLIG